MMYCFSILARCLASLYDGALMLLITGRFGMPVLYNLIVLLVLMLRGVFLGGYVFYLLFVSD